MTIDLPTITQQSQLVTYVTSAWGATRVDKRVTAEALASENAEENQGKFMKHIMGGNKTLAELSSYMSHVRNNVFYKRTLPWTGKGIRIIQHAPAIELQHEFETECVPTFIKIRDKFLFDYPKYVNDAQKLQGNMFDPDLYPSQGEMAHAFKMELHFQMLKGSTLDDWRLGVDAECQSIADEMFAQHQAEEAKKLNVANKAMCDQVFKYVERMAERLDYNDGDKSKIFRDTLLSNVEDAIGLLRNCNVTGDTRYTAWADELQRTLHKVNCDVLRNNTTKRIEVQGVCKRIATDIQSLPSLDLGC